MNFKKLLFLNLIVLLAITNAKAQTVDSLKPQDIFNMSLQDMLNVPIKVSSTIPTDVFNSPSTVTVIDRETIDQYNFLNVAEAIRQIAGVEILQTVIDKNVPTFRGILQNFYANKVLIMINNTPVWNPTYGNSTIDRVSINDIDRIEVLKGPASVLYGTNAYNGVINLILRKTDDSQLHAQVTAGYPEKGEASVNYGEQNGAFNWNISANSGLELRQPYLFNGSADTLKIDQETLYENDTQYYYSEEIRQSNFNVNLKYKSHEFLSNNYINSFTTPGVNATYQTGANRSVNDKGTLLSYTNDLNFSERSNLRTNIYFDYHARNQQMSQAQEIAAQFKSFRSGAIIKFNHQVNKQLSLELGSDIFNGHNMQHQIIAVAYDSVISTNITNATDIIEGSFFGQINYSKAWFRLTGGARYTINNHFGGNLSPRLSTLFSLNKNNKIRMVYGQSFRTPNLLELYFDHWTVQGNKDLKPETNQSVEISYLTQIKNFYGNATFYHSQYKDLIQRVRDSDDPRAPATYQNASTFEGYGIEAEARYQNPKIVNINLNYNLATGDETGERVNFRYVPKHTFSLGINKPIRKLFVATNMYWYSKAMGHEIEIPAQGFVDFTVGYKHKSSKKIKLIHSISAKNITANSMLIPEYIRQKPGVNSLSTMGYGRRIVYTLKINF